MDSDSYSQLFAAIQFQTIPAGSILALCITILLLCFSAWIAIARANFMLLSQANRASFEEGDNLTDKIVRSLFARQEQLLASLTIWKVFLNTAIVVSILFIINQCIDISSNPEFGIFLGIIIPLFLIPLSDEIIPNLLLRDDASTTIRRSAPFLRGLEIITRPLSFILIRPGGYINRIFERRKNEVSVGELSRVLDLTPNELPEEKEMLEGVIGLYNKTAVEIMTPRMNFAELCIKTEFQDVINYVIEAGYSRIPVYGENRDDIRGILYSKDLLPYIIKQSEFEWQKLIRPAYFIPENKKVDDLLEDFQKNKIHLAIVIDEFGGTSGIVTLEDILEEIVGEIDDEHDEVNVKYIRTSDGSYIFNAIILLTDFFRVTRLDSREFDEFTEDVDTLAGLILEIKGDFPEEREVVRYKNYSFRILKMDKKRITKVKFTIEPAEKKPDEK
ncbi:gliding motility-associated protein GldE [Bacteroidales bacterium OttesenSCG-928-A17]|nr:gliding motility-associated protein GldE [Bacteroidales bacterium OttesenSCG-928-A17]